jgi:diadenosine tetraphosphate (Ap4A) HIT family hydrolase
VTRGVRSGLLSLGVFFVGLVVGGYLFAASQPRSFLAVPDCDRSCLRPSELAGLLASVGVQRASGLIPLVVKETDRCIAIRHPIPSARIHYVVFPKKDVKDIADVAIEDQPYVLDCLAVIRALVREQRLRTYRVITNGSGFQHVTYLHFHLVSGGRAAEFRVPEETGPAVRP